MTTPFKIAEKPVKSPCVSLCALDIDDVCMGCQRTGQEISRVLKSKVCSVNQ